MKKQYVQPRIEIDEYVVEKGYAYSATFDGDIIDDDVDRRGCNCGGFDCCCNSRSECRGNGFMGCKPKHYANDDYYVD